MAEDNGAEQVQPVDAGTVDAEVVDAETVIEDEMTKARAEAEEARAQAAAHLDDLKRLKAEFENYRKRVIKEQTQLVEFASQQMAEKMLPILDNFELALLAADQTKDVGKLVHGVEMVFGDLLGVLHKEGLRKIEAEGQPFDPECHEAVMQDEGGEGDLAVVDVLRAGYTLKGRVIRPAMVKVARR